MVAVNSIISVMILYNVIRNVGVFYLTFNTIKMCKNTIVYSYENCKSLCNWVFTKKD